VTSISIPSTRVSECADLEAEVAVYRSIVRRRTAESRLPRKMREVDNVGGRSVLAEKRVHALQHVSARLGRPGPPETVLMTIDVAEVRVD
jgi:hypothetical protein